MFHFVDELKLVDWDTIAVYTCQNLECLPDFSSDQYFSAEYGYIQVSEDFSKVKYGDEKEIAAQKQFNKKILQQEQQMMEQESKMPLNKIEEEKEDI